jgi:hypothetical protein
MARLWINHPGELKPWGERRPSLLAGNHVLPRVAQEGPVALLIFDLDRPWSDIRFTQVFAAPDAVGAPVRQGDWLVFADMVALWCAAPLAPVTQGLYRGALWRADGARMGWVVAMREPREDARDFARRLARAKIGFDADRLSLEADGLGPAALTLAFDGPFTVDGRARDFAPLTPEPQTGWDGAALAPWHATAAPS